MAIEIHTHAAATPANRTFNFNLPRVASSPVFWLGTAAIVFAYFTAKGSSEETGQGLNNALTIIGVAGGAALIIYAINKA